MAIDRAAVWEEIERDPGRAVCVLYAHLGDTLNSPSIPRARIARALLHAIEEINGDAGATVVVGAEK